MSPDTEQIAHFLQSVSYQSVVGFPYLTVYLHLLISALFPIYTGAHASLSRPSSAAKPPKENKKRSDRDDESGEQDQKMEGLGPLDALLLPLTAGALLAGLYFVIKWLEDPTLLNQILNWYFAGFGVLSLARMLTDGMGVITSIVFPEIYVKAGSIWEIDAKHRRFRQTSSPSVEQDSPTPETSTNPELPFKLTNAMWIFRELPSRQLDIRIYIHRMMEAKFKIGPQGITSLLIAVAALLYFNLIDKPWWLTNLLGFGFAYSALQIMSPTTSWTGTLILGALFIYDIYFVFFTPLMVTVATQLDIPAKLVFPRPSRSTEDPAKQALAMLGLGDIILPGMMIGFALRFDLHLFYLRKQTQRKNERLDSTEHAANDSGSNKADDSDILKATWHSATGGWGERLWTSKKDILRSKRFQGVVFPKTYFHASIIGYFLAMLCTLGVMSIYGQAQPALLYLVPGVLGSLWGTALIKGDIKTLWAYDESENQAGYIAPTKGDKQDSIWKKDSWMDVDWKSLFSYPGTSIESENLTKNATNNDTSDAAGKRYSKRLRRSGTSDETTEKPKRSGSSHDESTQQTQSSDNQLRSSKTKKKTGRDNRKKDNADGIFSRERKSELVFISVNLPRPASISKQAKSSAQGGHGTRVRGEAKVEGNGDDGFGGIR